jgi:hypothetical protein
MTVRTSEITLPTFLDIRNNVNGYMAQVNEGHSIRFLLLPGRPTPIRPQTKAQMLNMEKFREEWGDRASATVQLSIFKTQPQFSVDKLNRYGAIVVRQARTKQDLFAIIKEEEDADI